MTNFENLRSSLKEGEVLGIDVEVGKVYQSKLGTIVKIDKKTDINGTWEIYGTVIDTKVIVKIPLDVVLKEVKMEKNEVVEPENLNLKKIKFKKEWNFENLSEKELYELYLKVREWLIKNYKGTKATKQTVKFVVDGVRCCLHPNATVVAKQEISGIKPRIFAYTYVRYYIKDLFDKIGYK